MLLSQSVNDFALLCFATIFPIILLMFVLMYSSTHVKVLAFGILVSYEIIIMVFWIFVVL